MQNTDNLHQVVSQYDDEVKVIEANNDLKDEAKARRILALNDKVLDDYGRAYNAVLDSFEAERSALEAKASGAGGTPEPKDMQTELRAMRSEIAARDMLDSGHAGAIFEGYQQAIADGNEAAMGVYERRGPGKLTDLGIPLTERQRFEELVRESKVARMSPEQLEAREELAAYDKRRGTVEMGLTMQRDTFFNRVRGRNDFYRYGKDAS